MIQSSVLKKKSDVEKNYINIQNPSFYFNECKDQDDLSFIGGPLNGDLEINEHVVQNPMFTYFIKIGENFHFEDIVSPGNVLVVDRSLIPKIGQLVIAVVNGTLSLVRVRKHSINSYLVDGQNNSILMFDRNDVSIWGVVTFIIQKLPQLD
jgi:DNA polymerase V